MNHPEESMLKTATLDVTDENILTSIQDFLRSMLALEGISAVLAPQRLPMKPIIMPTLTTDPDRLNHVDPLAPVFPINAAKVVSKLTRKPIGKTVAAVLRPCEIRAFIELLKLNQGRMEDVVIVGVDCLGAYKNTDYVRFIGDDAAASTEKFVQNAYAGKTEGEGGFDLSPACRACEYPVPVGADILIGFFGVDPKRQMIVQAQTPNGEKIFVDLGLKETGEPKERAAAVAAVLEKRTAFRDQLFEQTKAAAGSLEKLTTYLANCVNCYNCRVACPVCYCKECVFVTDVFNHEPSQYLKWAQRNGMIKMPTDTVFYHLTRMAHMSTACVGCGQCSNACPNDIPVLELFRTVSHRTQNAFDYVAGRSIDEAPPMSVFREDEYQEVVGV